MRCLPPKKRLPAVNGRSQQGNLDGRRYNTKVQTAHFVAGPSKMVFLACAGSALMEKLRKCRDVGTISACSFANSVPTCGHGRRYEAAVPGTAKIRTSNAWCFVTEGRERDYFVVMRSACDIVTLSEVSEALRRTFPIMCNIGGRHVQSCECIRACRCAERVGRRQNYDRVRMRSPVGMDFDLEMVEWNLLKNFLRYIYVFAWH